MSSFKIPYSHPNKPLKNHLKQVISDSLTSLSKLFQTNYLKIYHESVKEILRIIAFCHDVGKATVFFQEKLFKGKFKNSKLSSHSFLSSLFGLVLLELYFNNTKANAFETSKDIIIIAGYTIIKNHHSILGDLSTQIGDLLTRYKGETFITKQFESLILYAEYLEKCFIELISAKIPCLTGTSFKNVLTRVKSVITLVSSGQDSTQYLDFIYDLIHNFKRFLFNKSNQEYRIVLYLLLKVFNSIFLEADKMDAAFNGIKPLDPLNMLNLKDNIDRRVKEFQEKVVRKENLLNSYRNEIYFNTKKNIRQFLKSEQSKILTFNAPTGFGKTISVIRCASEIIRFEKSARKNLDDEIPKIVYCLPFLSITDQIYSEFLKILEINEKNASHDIILHNHRTEMNFQSVNDEILSGLDARLLIEAWNSNIIVSTFHQLFYSMFYNRNMLNIKFHKLFNSVIILDEIQCFPLKYWDLIKEVFTLMVKYFNVKIILVSATLPMIIPKESSYELVRNKNNYFENLNRVAILVHESVKQTNTQRFYLKDLLEFVNTILLKGINKSFLLTFNTRRSAKVFYDKINQLVSEDPKIQLYFLSSDVLVKERQDRIEEVKEKLENSKKHDRILVLISTQVVEAGVDLDFDIVIRDFAPLDSLIQVAGRCNRNNRASRKGNFYIFKLYDEEYENYYCNYIYDRDLLTTTQKILTSSFVDTQRPENFLKYTENRWFKFSHQYYEEINRIKTPDYSFDILNEVKNFNLQEIANKFQLIEDRSNFQFFLDLDDSSHEMWEQYSNLKKIEDPIERYSEYLKLKTGLEAYILNYNANKKEFALIEKFLRSQEVNLDKDIIYLKNEIVRLTYSECGLNFTNVLIEK